MRDLSFGAARHFDKRERLRLGGLFGVVGLIHVAGWGLLLLTSSGRPAMLGLGALAYTFGLRHAFDADHISAIDNTTRKLLHDNRRPLGVGFFFSLGHSTVVFAIALALGFAVKWLVEGVVSGNGQLRAAGALLGTSVSGLFLVVIGLVNLAILIDIVRTYRRLRSRQLAASDVRAELATGGLMSRVFGPVFRLVRDSWQMYFVGFLFGLGFDTASEVALLAITGGVAAKGGSFLAVLSLPLIFAAGMTLMDTADGAFMSKAYAWAFAKPVRRIFYNLTVTSLSVFVALFVGLVEVAQIAVQVFGLKGGLFDAVAGLDLANLGLVIVAAFVLTWIGAFLIFKLRRVEERWTGYLEG